MANSESSTLTHTHDLCNILTPANTAHLPQHRFFQRGRPQATKVAVALNFRRTHARHNAAFTHTLRLSAGLDANSKIWSFSLSFRTSSSQKSHVEAADQGDADRYSLTRNHCLARHRDFRRWFCGWHACIGPKRYDTFRLDDAFINMRL